jgi:hypothetical protein
MESMIGKVSSYLDPMVHSRTCHIFVEFLLCELDLILQFLLIFFVLGLVPLPREQPASTACVICCPSRLVLGEL